MTQASEADRTAGEDSPNRVGWKAALAICAVILISGAALVAFIYATEPAATRAGATKQTAMLVEVSEARAGDFRPTIVATGTVRPAREIVLRPRVQGEVVQRAPAFVPGGIVAKGEMLLRLDPSDYRNALQQRESEIEQARAELNIERGQQDVAEQEYRLLDRELGPDKRALALREPQLEVAQSRVASARAGLEQARLNLQRTTIKAPFDARVVTRAVNVGSQVAAGDELARLVGAETYWVETTVPVAKLAWLEFPESADDQGSKTRIRNAGAWPSGTARTGYLYKLVGTLSERTRMARVLVAIDDPLARLDDDTDKPALLLGSYVEARIQGRTLRDVVRIDRDHVRQNDTVWVMRDGKLDIRDVRIAVRDSEYAYIREGLSEGERVIVSDLATIRDGAPLRLPESSSGARETARDDSARRDDAS